MNLIVGFGGNLVLARLLTPRDFGIIAIGATLMLFTTSLADGGLGSGLIRRETEPNRRELKAALALQLALTLLLAGLAAGIGLLVEGAGLVVALMVAALPIAAFQTPGRVILSRAVRFKALSTIEATREPRLLRVGGRLRRLRRLGRVGARLRRPHPRDSRWRSA